MMSFPVSHWSPPAGGGGSNPVIADSQLGIVTSGGAGASVSITFGSAVSVGQLIVLAVRSGFKDGTNTITTPSGFTLLYGDSAKYGLYYKIATGLEGATFTVANVDQAGFLTGLKITGSSVGSPINASAITAASLVSPSVTTTVNNALLLSFVYGTASIAPTTPSGWTAINGSGVAGGGGGPVSLASAWLNQTSMGATGTATWSSAGGSLQVITAAISP